MTTAPEAPKPTLPAIAEELVIENKMLRQRLMSRAAEVDSLRAQIRTFQETINSVDTSDEEKE